MVSEHTVQTLGLDEAQLAFMKQWFRIILLMYFILNVIQQRNCFWNLTTGMERMEEYVEEESPFTEPENLPRDPILEDLTTNSS